jgi:hypothetical protein
MNVRVREKFVHFVSPIVDNAIVVTGERLHRVRFVNGHFGETNFLAC